jgi:hypothetical protein
MVTPDFEDWLRRADIPVEETVTLDRYLGYLQEELGIKGGSLEVAKDIYSERYELWEELGIRPVPRKYTVEGEEFTETRYGIAGNPGLWGRESMLLFAEAMAEEQGLEEMAERIRAIRREEYGGE